jgi:hypothetical protein
MIGTVTGHPFHSSRRLISPSKRLLYAAMHVELHDRRAPGLVGSVLILAVVAMFVLGLLWGPLNALARLF